MFLAVGVILGFTGAGGGGVIVALLSVGFDLSIHEAVGTALAAMVFVTLSGAISHYREGNVHIRSGLVVGLVGTFGAVLGAQIGQSIPDEQLRLISGFALWVLALLVWLRSRLSVRVIASLDESKPVHIGRQTGALAGLGITGGLASALFGVGMTPFIQLGMLTISKLSLTKSVGTTMLALIFISISGSAALAGHGEVSFKHLLGVTIGTVIGTYVGAKYTRRAPIGLLRFSIAALPFVAGTLLIFTR
ncbi:MAG: sulfite exporter TauE/SafE family protein [Thermomicrobiales bacterium]